MNEITLIGHLPIRPTYHCNAQGQDLVRFEIRTTSNITADTPSEEAHHCIAWGPAALDLHTHLRPGDRLLIRGELGYRSKRDRLGNSIRIPKIHVKAYSYLGAKAEFEVVDDKANSMRKY